MILLLRPCPSEFVFGYTVYEWDNRLRNWFTTPPRCLLATVLPGSNVRCARHANARCARPGPSMPVPPPVMGDLELASGSACHCHN